MGTAADLHATGLAIDPSSMLQSDGSVTIDWNDTDVGNTAASGAWSDRVTVVNSTTDATLVTTSVNVTANGGTLPAGQSQPEQASFVLPAGVQSVGQLLITVLPDTGNALPELAAGGTPDLNRSASISAASALALIPTWWWGWSRRRRVPCSANRSPSPGPT